VLKNGNNCVRQINPRGRAYSVQPVIGRNRNSSLIRYDSVTISHLLKVGKAPLDNSVKRTVRDEWRQYLRRRSSSSKPDAVTTSEIDKVSW